MSNTKGLKTIDSGNSDDAVKNTAPSTKSVPVANHGWMACVQTSFPDIPLPKTIQRETNLKKTEQSQTSDC